MAELVTEIPKIALAVYAHPDDADVACGGTLARWARGGSEVHLVVCTDGGRGTRDKTIDMKRLADQRAEELAAAGKLIGLASHHNLGVADGELTEGRTLTGELVGWVRELRPDALFGHDPTAVFFGEHYFNHRDHRVAGWALLDAVFPAATLPHYFPEKGEVHAASVAYLSGTLEPDVWVDVSDTIEVKAAAVQCHKSQFTDEPDWAADAVRLRAEEEGRRAGVAYAEGFRRLFLET